MHKTLCNVSDLRESRFGRPPPRHGLDLLWWFVHHCVRIDSNGQTIAQCDPTNGAFGFHRFFNREGLLPRTNLMYYEVGNLNYYSSLPEYVTENYKGRSDISNSDRIIASYDSKSNRFESVYVTRHSDVRNFDQNHTFCITIGLLKLIKDMSRKQFLREISNESENRENLPNTIINMDAFLNVILNSESENHPRSFIKTLREPAHVESVEEIREGVLHQISTESENNVRVSVINVPQSMETEPVRRQSSRPFIDSCAKSCLALFGVIMLAFIITILMILLMNM